jgi:hypothetical protein
MLRPQSHVFFLSRLNPDILTRSYGIQVCEPETQLKTLLCKKGTARPAHLYIYNCILAILLINRENQCCGSGINPGTRISDQGSQN